EPSDRMNAVTTNRTPPAAPRAAAKTWGYSHGCCLTPLPRQRVVRPRERPRPGRLLRLLAGRRPRPPGPRGVLVPPRVRGVRPAPAPVGRGLRGPRRGKPARLRPAPAPPRRQGAAAPQLPAAASRLPVVAGAERRLPLLGVSGYSGC